MISLSILSILIIGFLFLEKKIYIESAAGILFVIAVFQVFGLQYFFKNQLKNDVVKSNLEFRVDELKRNLDIAETVADQKSIYLANMSYEIRTPLSTVLGMLNMLKEANLESDQLAEVEIAEYSSLHISQLVNMIADNAVVERGKFKLNLNAIDLKADLLKLLKVFEFQALEKGLAFEYKFLSENDDKFLVVADSAKIQQVLINLINNAIKFTNSGKVTVTIDQTIGADDSLFLTFYIKDTGVGMSHDEVKFLFNNKNDLSKSNLLRDYRGGGIGLSVSHKLVELMGGELKIESKENEGSTFYFSLQLKKTLNIKSDLAEPKPIILNKLNVLVAEDNRTNQKVIKALLERQGADCTFVKNGLEAVELYKILDFDLIFMDIYMPDMDGYEATRLIKSTNKYAQKNTPIIAVSASAFEEDIIKAKEAGIDDFLAKPIEVIKLKELLISYSNLN
ncbi:response regulator [Tamlana sp. 2_MG-2023]|uniref:response regulator n=1 Tax=unclassified Tamlana TaxID=2614803 RepID=UPI0026E1951C|nr:MULTISPECIES: response regulator [unclassified Tamlana]MDO6759302.1 response regulator [Tamlana sp. 2_MG-2023]MDO6790559.1 response regulator [Tamlana sp. 1_MG-2023]